ncbi:MAG: hypothetical protein HXY34_11230 [Candidatus Thorarchaeota archaeon]|nr:hypothetical protein [Candidatus Thorarchaeota archaeon]
MIRRKKMAQLVQREKQLQAEREHKAKVSAERSKLLKRYLAPDAVAYLESLKTRDPPVGNKVEEVLLYLIVYRGVRETIGQTDVMYIERLARGEEPKIRVHRDGETSDFGAYVREAIKGEMPKD